MTSTYAPATALRKRVVALLRADATLCDPTTGLLYSVVPKSGASDYRVWSASTDLPPDPNAILALPRVMIECVGRAVYHEQDDPAILQGAVRLFVHTVAPKDHEELGERIDAYITRLLLSTWLSDARIIAARLSLDGDRRTERVPALDGAWQITSGFSTPNVGSLL